MNLCFFSFSKSRVEKSFRASKKVLLSIFFRTTILFVILSCMVNPNKPRWPVHPQLESQRHQKSYLLLRKNMPWQSFLESSLQQRRELPCLCPRSLRRRSWHTGPQAAFLWMTIYFHGGKATSISLLILLNLPDITFHSQVHLYQVREFSQQQGTLSLQVDLIFWQRMWTNLLKEEHDNGISRAVLFESSAVCVSLVYATFYIDDLIIWIIYFVNRLILLYLISCCSLKDSSVFLNFLMLCHYSSINVPWPSPLIKMLCSK